MKKIIETIQSEINHVATEHMRFLDEPNAKVIKHHLNDISEKLDSLKTETDCKHSWKVAGVASNINTIDDKNEYFRIHYQKKELVVVTSLYCPKCGEMKERKVYT